MALILQYLMADTDHNIPEGWYLCFDRYTPREKAIETFVQRYKSEPKETIIYKRLLWVGPIELPEYNPTVGNFVKPSKIPAREE